MDMKLEVVVIPVSDVDRAKAFYEKLGFRLDIDYARDEDHRVVQFTPPGSEASIHIGKGITSAAPGSVQNLYLIISDIEKARVDLMGRGIDVSEVFHFAGLLGPRGDRSGSETWVLWIVCHVQRSGRERMAAAGNHDATSRSRMEIGATTSDGRSHAIGAPSRNGRAPRQVRKDASQA